MPIAEDFPKGLKPTGKISLTDGEHFHFVWGLGKVAEAAADEKVKADYKAHGEKTSVNFGMENYIVTRS